MKTCRRCGLPRRRSLLTPDGKTFSFPGFTVRRHRGLLLASGAALCCCGGCTDTRIFPDSDISTGNWDTSALYSKIDEWPASDADYASLVLVGGESTAQRTFRVRLSNPHTNPWAGTSDVRWRIYRNSPTDTGILSLTVYEGASSRFGEIYSFGGSYIEGTFVDAAGGSLSGVSNWDSLEAEFVASDVSPIPVVVLPIQDIQVGAWNVRNPPPSELWDALVSASEEIISTTDTGTKCIVLFGGPGGLVNGSGGHVLTIYWSFFIGSQPRFDWELLQGSTVIASGFYDAAVGGTLPQTYTLTAGEVSSITDYNDLRFSAAVDLRGSDPYGVLQHVQLEYESVSCVYRVSQMDIELLCP